MRQDLYSLLGVSSDADAATIRRAYQRLARRHHPDLHPGDPEEEELFELVTRAYEVLSDAELRGEYDRDLAAVRKDPDVSTSTWSESRRSPASRAARYIAMEGIFAATSRREAERPRSSVSGRHLQMELTLDFAEAVRGTVRSLSLQREVACPECGDSGGTAGRGCGRCGGRGVVVELDRLRVRIPAGVDDGSRLRLAGRGNPGVGSGAAGDVHLAIRVHPHPYFRRAGLDVHADLPVTVAEAITGAEVEAPTIDGPVRVKIPPGTSGGQRYRLRGRGIRSSTGQRGDHYYTVRIELPTSPGRELFELLKSACRESPRAHLPRERL